MMKKILKIGSFLIIVISLILLPRAIKEFDTKKMEL
jgi:hypothetical protein